MTCDKCETHEGYKYPKLRTQNGYAENPQFASQFSISQNNTLNFPFANNQQFDCPALYFPELVKIGKGTMKPVRAHLCFRDIFIRLSNNGTMTATECYFYFKDLSGRVHYLYENIGSFASAINLSGLFLTVETPLYEAENVSFGNFGVETVALTAGTATSIFVWFRANCSILYEG